jgi:hypothetical protein
MFYLFILIMGVVVFDPCLNIPEEASSKIKGRSFVYIMNKRGPKMLP